MSAAVSTGITDPWGDRPRCWQEVIGLSQGELAATLREAIRDGRLNRASYQHWLATESALCRINALALEAVAGWHVSSPPLRAIAHGWATSLRGAALAAAADVRGIDGMAAATPPQVVAWETFVESAARCARAGEALGAVVLHARLFGGPARDAIAGVTELPFLPVRGSRYLLQRCQEEASPSPRDCEALLSAYSSASLSAGARRAAAWYRGLLATVLAVQATATRTHVA